MSAGDRRGPLTVPIWYQYRPGGDPWVLTGAGSRKHRLIEAQGEFTLMVERDAPTRIEPGTDDQLVEMTKRYLAPDKVDAYLDYARRELGEHVAISSSRNTGFRPTWGLPDAMRRRDVAEELDGSVARRLLSGAIPARFAYLALDGTPRAIQSGFCGTDVRW